MATIDKIVNYLEGNFATRFLENFKEEVELTYNSKENIKRIGYATNLTVDIIEQANLHNIDLIITHHDAWGFIGGLKEECMRLLKEYGISHYYNHLPLDDCDFGTNSSLAKELGLKEVNKCAESDGFKCGVIGEYDSEIDFSSFVQLVELKLGEKIQAWNFGNKSVKRVFILCGAGFSTLDMKEAIDEKCDVYLTGEKILYTVEYAQFHKINLVVGSHTFTELFGVENMAKLLLEEFKDLELILLKEEHIEAQGFS